jgi:hypothetical protein
MMSGHASRSASTSSTKARSSAGTYETTRSAIGRVHPPGHLAPALPDDGDVLQGEVASGARHLVALVVDAVHHPAVATVDEESIDALPLVVAVRDDDDELGTEGRIEHDLSAAPDFERFGEGAHGGVGHVGLMLQAGATGPGVPLAGYLTRGCPSTRRAGAEAGLPLRPR